MSFNRKNKLSILLDQKLFSKKTKYGQPDNAFFVHLPAEIHRTSFSPYLSDSEIYNINLSSYSLYSIYQPDLETRAFKKLLVAVIDDDAITVKKLLDSKPELLIKQLEIKESVESKKTWQSFFTDTPFKIATQRRQLSMVKLLLNYFKQLEEKNIIEDGKCAALSQWGIPPIKDQYNFEELLNIIPRLTEKIRTPDEETEKLLESFRITVLPDNPIALDNDFDVEKLLLCAYLAYEKNVPILDNLYQRFIFCIYVIGFIQSLLSPENSQDFCNYILNDHYGNLNVTENLSNTQIAKFKHNIYASMHRSAKGCHHGIGFNFLFHATSFMFDDVFLPSGLHDESNILQKYIEEKTKNLAELKATLELGYWPQYDEFTKQSTCFIL